jgi:hypothetical protein
VHGDRSTGRLLGVQLLSRKDAGIAKRIDIAAAAIYNDQAPGRPPAISTLQSLPAVLSKLGG